jgi:predicted RNA binding protein YcfA (HicA-like mRNA interferase family)
MPVLPVLSGREVVRVFEKLGWQVARQRDSHIILVENL